MENVRLLVELTSAVHGCYLLSHFSQRKFNWMRWSAADQRKKLAAEAKNYCTYFNRFGRCIRGEKCNYIHDPDKVSVCTRSAVLLSL